MTFKPGQSGNPKGRPPKERSLTALLEKAGDATVIDADGKPVSGKRLVAQLLWEALTTGSVLLPNGHVMHFDGQEWAGLVFKVLAQVDGPPKHEVDLTSGGSPLTIQVVYGDDGSATNSQTSETA